MARPRRATARRKKSSAKTVARRITPKQKRSRRRKAKIVRFLRIVFARGGRFRAIRIGIVAIAGLALLVAANFVYQVARKPTELFFPVSGTLAKSPTETWRSYGSLFQRYSTDAVSPELLAALAQSEGSGDPIARTYWRWHASWHPFSIYQPASSAVGMYQMTDGAFADARQYCIRNHQIVEADACWFTSLYTRVIPAHAVELAAIYLERNVSPILARHGRAATSQQKQDLAAVVHLCGSGPAETFARRGFHPAGEKCGDHDVAAYLVRVNTMKRAFLRYTAED